MKILSTAFNNHEKIPAKYTCNGEDISPPLILKDIPKETVSLSLIVEDPDAPSKTWTHWVLFNIDPSTREILENSFPQDGEQGVTDSGDIGYHGPCPPSGTHRYIFRLFSLDTKLIGLSRGASRKEVEEAMKNHIIETAELTGLYKRP